MARFLIILPQQDFDPTEVAVPWKAWTDAGHEVDFATETGEAAICDPVTLTGQGLPFWAKSLRARPDNVALYGEMRADEKYSHPMRWADARAGDYSAVHFPGGHAPGMKPYLESNDVQRIAKEAFAGNKPVSAICHGVIPLVRAGLLKGRKTTALTATMEGIAVALTKSVLGNHYRTYPQSVEAETRAGLASPKDFDVGPMLPRFATQDNPAAGFIVQDGNYLSARWPGDAWTLAMAALKML